MEDIFAIIEAALREHGYKVLEGDRDNSFVRRIKDGADFEIKASKIEEDA